MSDRKLLIRRSAEVTDVARSIAWRAEHMLRHNHPEFWDDLMGETISDDGYRLRMLSPQAALQSDYLHAHRMWSTAPTTVSVHPDMLNEISEFKRDQMPSELLYELAYENPLLAFPTPPTAISLDGEEGQLLGAFTTGLSADGTRTVSTHSADRARLRLTLLTDYPSAGPTTSTMTLHADGKYFDVEAAIDTTARAHAEGDRRGRGFERHRATVRSELLPLLDSLMYLCASNIDTQVLEEKPTKADRKAAKRGNGKPSTPRLGMVLAGYRDGPDLAWLRRNPDEVRRLAHAAGLTLLPHPRRGYYGYRYLGPGRAVKKKVLVKPTYIHRGLVTASTKVTIVSAGQKRDIEL